MATSFEVERTAFSGTCGSLLVANDACLIVAQAPEGIIGYVLGLTYATFFANGHVFWVEEIRVKSNYRRKGVGKSLMAEFEACAISKKFRLIALVTHRASDFYHAIGYEESATYFQKLSTSNFGSFLTAISILIMICICIARPSFFRKSCVPVLKPAPGNREFHWANLFAVNLG
jgi:GNAT superfamily N-acetyltransferase